jgi:poly-gamma-glutamate synthesis protein (capsule biosynthesis protein)
MSQSLGNSLTLAVSGATIPTSKLSEYGEREFGDLVGEIRDADASLLNLEMLFHDYEGHPAPRTGTYMRAPPWVLDELTWAGFDVFASAHNHVGDYMYGGMCATMRELERRDLPYAGMGRSLEEAREPAYVDTPAGRVGLVAASDAFSPAEAAAARRGEVPGRPGVSPLGLTTKYLTPPEELERLRELGVALDLEDQKDYSVDTYSAARDERQQFRLLNVGGEVDLTFEAAEEHAVVREPDETDRRAILNQVHEAERQADWVIASVHTHAGRGPYSLHPSTPAFIEEFARDCVDAGADAFVGHGPHCIRGIELYDGAPIFYSVGSFVQETENITRQPQKVFDIFDMGPEATPADVYDTRAESGYLDDSVYWECVFPICRYEGDEIDQIELTPLELGFDLGRPRRGRPRRAEGEEAERILAQARDRSKPYGVEVRIEDGMGYVDAG